MMKFTSDNRKKMYATVAIIENAELDPQGLQLVLLHNGNNYPSIPIAHSARLKEDYTSVQRLLQAVKYEEHLWEGGYTKNSITFL
jgi:hypothetical protein